MGHTDLRVTFRALAYTYSGAVFVKVVGALLTEHISEKSARAARSILMRSVAITMGLQGSRRAHACLVESAQRNGLAIARHAAQGIRATYGSHDVARPPS